MHQSRLDVASDLGATVTLRGDTPNLVEEIQAATGGGSKFGLDTTGVPSVIMNAIRALGPRGTCGLLGVQTDDLVLDDWIQSGKALVSMFRETRTRK